jgi:hypothetical protein
MDHSAHNAADGALHSVCTLQKQPAADFHHAMLCTATTEEAHQVQVPMGILR